MKGEPASFSLRSIKDIRQSFCIQELSPGFVVNNLSPTEALPDEAFGKLTNIVFERGQWFICDQKHITTVGQDEIQVKSIVADLPDAERVKLYSRHSLRAGPASSAASSRRYQRRRDRFRLTSSPP